MSFSSFRRAEARGWSDGLLPFVFSVLFCTAGSAQTITEFPLPAGRSAWRIVAGPDGNLWFAEAGSPPQIGRITTEGAITEFPTTAVDAWPFGIVAGSDGNLWFAQNGEWDWEGRIGRITPAGDITQFPSGGSPWDIALGSDGALWFTESSIGMNSISRITTAGALARYRIPTSGYPTGIAAGPDGRLWFTHSANRIGRITTAGVITEFPIATSGSRPREITAGPDGNLWFTDYGGNKIGRITTEGVLTEFSIPIPAGNEGGIAAGPDGNVWFTLPAANSIGRVTATGEFTIFPLPTPGSAPRGITAGPEGNIWFTGNGQIGRLTLPRAPAIDSRILPVVGSTAGVGGSYFRTSVQLHNPTDAPMSGRVMFHPSARSGTQSDPAVAYHLSPGQTQSIADLLPAMGRSGLGSADIEVTAGTAPVATVRVFNDNGAAGTTGFTEDPMRAEDALQGGGSAVLLIPADLTRFRFNLGVRTLDADAAATLTVRDPSGAVVETVPLAFPRTYHEQQSATTLLGVFALPAGGSIGIAMNSGSAVFYGATVDNTTGDPSLQIARSVR